MLPFGPALFLEASLPSFPPTVASDGPPLLLPGISKHLPKIPPSAGSISFMFSVLFHFPLKFLSLSPGRLRSTVFPEPQIAKALTCTLCVIETFNNYLHIKIHTIFGAGRGT